MMSEPEKANGAGKGGVWIVVALVVYLALSAVSFSTGRGEWPSCLFFPVGETKTESPAE